MPVVNYHSANGRLIGETTSGVRTDYMTDALGSVTGTLNASQAVVNTYRYKPYGELLAKTGSGADPAFMWNGTTQSRRTGLAFSDQYNRARHYGTRQGQWTTVDPLWPSLQQYSYGWLNPATLNDPSGYCPGKLEYIWQEPLCFPGVKEIPGYWYPTHPCSDDPCKFTLDNNPNVEGKNGWVACCLGKAYACVRPGAFPDPSVKYCALQHEEDHVRRNKSCQYVGNSGCLGLSPKDRDLGGGWFDTGNNRDECLAYLAEHACLDNAAKKYGCNPSDAPFFRGHPNRQKCIAIFGGIGAACLDSNPNCLPLGWKRPVCDRWKVL